MARPPGNGIYDLSVKVNQWLRKTVRINLSSGDANGIILRPANGDCDRDNYIGTNDYLVLNATFDKWAGEPGFDDRGDLDGDGYAGSDDYLILSKNFDTYGD